MAELGYAKDRDFNFVARFSEGVQDRLPMEAEELAQLQPDVILAAAVVGAVTARRFKAGLSKAYFDLANNRSQRAPVDLTI